MVKWKGIEMYIFLSNGKIVCGEQPSLCGCKVIGVFLTKDDKIKEIASYYENEIDIRMMEINKIDIRMMVIKDTNKESLEKFFLKYLFSYYKNKLKKRIQHVLRMH